MRTKLRTLTWFQGTLPVDSGHFRSVALAATTPVAVSNGQSVTLPDSTGYTL